MAAAADHARGLVEQDAALLERVAVRYSAAGARATALEDAGRSWVGQGNQPSAEALLRQAYALYEELGSAEGAARVRAWLRPSAPGSATGPTRTGRPSAGTA